MKDLNFISLQIKKSAITNIQGHLVNYPPRFLISAHPIGDTKGSPQLLVHGLDEEYSLEVITPSECFS